MSLFKGVPRESFRKPAPMTAKQQKWLIGLRDVVDFDRVFVPHPATEASCERRGWATYAQLIGTKMGWRITPAGRKALQDRAATPAR